MNPDHPTRQELIAAARTGKVWFASHLHTCVECRDLFSLFRAFPLAGEPLLQSAPSAWVARASSIAESKVSALVRKLTASLTFDSWTLTPALGVRGPQTGKRRLQFSVEDTTIDLQAVHKADRWQMTARVVPEQAEFTAYQLTVNRQSIFPDSQGYFVWSAARPPIRLSIRSNERIITFPKLSWGAPKK